MLIILGGGHITRLGIAAVKVAPADIMGALGVNDRQRVHELAYTSVGQVYELGKRYNQITGTDYYPVRNR